MVKFLLLRADSGHGTKLTMVPNGAKITARRAEQIRVSYLLRVAIVLRSIEVYLLVLWFCIAEAWEDPMDSPGRTMPIHIERIGHPSGNPLSCTFVLSVNPQKTYVM